MAQARCKEAAPLRLRRAGPADVEAIARLHAESWRAHYRGAYSEDFLDGDLLAERLSAWTAALADPARLTILAGAPELVGFASVIADAHPVWGSLLDNLHVALERKRGGLGSRLLAAAATELTAARVAGGLYLWVLEQNHDAQAFYRARGARYAGREPVTPPGGIGSRLTGAPVKLRFAWGELRELCEPGS